MSKFRQMMNAFAIVIFTITVASLTQAQATRTWVSGVGDDANPCSRTAPCKTFAGAISKTAASGEIDAIDPGGFGAVTITKSITIDGGGTFASILASLTNGIIVNDGATATPGTIIVTIRNLSINGAGNGLNGIRFLRGKSLHVENVEISGFTQNGIDAPLAGNVAVGNTKMFLDDVDIRDLRGASSIGVKASAPNAYFGVVMDHVRTQRIPTGAQFGSNVFPTIRNSLFTSGGTGIEMVNAAAGSPVANIENTDLSENVTGLRPGTGTTTQLSQVSITVCSTGIANAGGVVRSSGNNRILGNSNDGLTPTIVNPK
jgi:hypothetical protein